MEIRQEQDRDFREMVVYNIGIQPYQKALAFQKFLHAKRVNNLIPDTVILLEHTPVITAGRRTNPDHILFSREELATEGIDYFETDRGGEATYHAPGQLVAYFIHSVTGSRRLLLDLIDNIEKSFIDILDKDFQIKACQIKKHRGVWAGDSKIAALGLAVHSGVTMHGIAFNVNTDLSGFGRIIPCGITDGSVTSLSRLTGKLEDMNKIRELAALRISERFRTVLSKIITADPDTIMGLH